MNDPHLHDIPKEQPAIARTSDSPVITDPPRASRDPRFSPIPVAIAVWLLVFGLYPLANRLTVEEAVPWFRHARLFWTFIGGGILVVLLLLGQFLRSRMERLWSWLATRFMRIPAPLLVGAAAVFALVASAVFATICFGRQPHNSDEVAQLFHAKILLSGRLYLTPEANMEFFGMDNMIEQGKWYSQFPIGGPAFLAIGVALHAAWLLDPVLLALTVVCTYLFARRAFDEATGRTSALLLALSPFALFVAASFMNHVPTMWLASVAMWQLAVWADATTPRQASRSAALIGLALGAAFTVRPLDALVVAAVIGVVQLTMLRRAPHRVRSLIVQVAAGLLPCLAMFYVNARTNGAPLRLGYEVLYGSAHQLGFHTDPYGTEHTPVRAAVFASKYLLQLDVLMFEWPLPVIAVIAAGLIALRKPRRWDYLLIGLFTGQVVAYALYWHDGSFRGPRFLYTALPAIAILAARAPMLIARVTRGAPRIAAQFILPVCVLVAWLSSGMGDSVAGRIRMYSKASPIGRVDADRLARDAKLHHALVFVNEGKDTRNLHALWALGITRGDAARLMATAPSCTIRMAIDAERARRPATEKGRLTRLVMSAKGKDTSVAIPPSCLAEEQLDAKGDASYAPFFPANTIERDGRLGGDVVYALDIGEKDELLRARFGDRAWYRWGPRRDPKDTLPTLIPYERFVPHPVQR